MPLIILAIGLLFPRLVIVLLWLFTTWMSAVDLIIGIIGIVFVPYTLLWYVTVLNLYGGVWGFWQLVILGIALLMDLYGHYSSWYAVYPEEV